MTIEVLAAPPACPDRTSVEELARSVGEAEQALRDLDDAAFQHRFNVLAGLTLPCAEELLDPSLAARYHALMGLHLFAVGDVAGATDSVVAVRRLQPEAPLPEDLVAPDHELRAAWAADDGQPRFRRVPEPRSGSLAFDGTSGRSRPLGVPTVLQRFDESGLLTDTRYLGARDPLPEYPAIPRRRTALAATAAASGLASAAMFAVAGTRQARMYSLSEDPLASAGDLERLRAQGNTWTALAAAALVGGLGAGAGAVVVGQR